MSCRYLTDLYKNRADATLAFTAAADEERPCDAATDSPQHFKHYGCMGKMWKFVM